MQIIKEIRKIPPMYKLIAMFLIFLGILAFYKRGPYVKIFEENQAEYNMPFLQEGRYEFEITYVGFQPGDHIWIYSNAMMDDRNQAGVTLAEATVPEYAGIVSLSIALEDGTRNICVTNDSKVGHFAEGKVQSVSLQNRDSYFLMLCFFFMAAVVLIGGYGKFFEKRPVFCMLVGMGVLASIPLFSDFLYVGDDISFHLARLEGIFQTLRAGEFPVRVNTIQNRGYGNLSASMYPSLFLMPFAMLRFLKVSLMLCFKIMVMAINIATALVSYYSVRRLCNSHKIGMWASFLYTFSAYRLNDLYLRCAIGETLALVFFPLLLWGTYEVLWGDEKKWPVLLLGMTGVLQSHVLSTEICGIFMTVELLLWLAFGSKSGFRNRIFSGMKALALTVLLNAGFLIPFVCFSMQDLQGFHIENELAQFTAYFTQMFSLFMSAEGGAVSDPPGGTRHEMAISVGFVLLAGAVLFCANQIRNRGTDDIRGKLGRRCLGYGVICLVMSSWLFPWEKLLELEWFEALSAPLQFPWRFLGIASVCLCVVTAIAVETFREKGRDYVKILIAGLAICSTVYCFDSICQSRHALNDKMELEGVDHSDSMYMYYISDQYEAWHLELSWEDAAIACLDSKQVTYSDYSRKGTQISVTTHNPGNEEDMLVFPLCYYPGYVVRVDGEPVETKIYYEPILMVACDLPKQTAHVTVAYEGLWIFKAGDALSLATAAGLAAAAWKRRKRRGCSR